MYTVKQEYEALVQSRDEQVRIMEQELKKTNSKLRDVQLHASALEVIILYILCFLQFYNL